MSSGDVAEHVRVGTDDKVRLVLGLEPTHVEQVAAGLDARQPMSHQIRGRVTV